VLSIDEIILLQLHISYFIATILMGYLMRIFVDPEEAKSLKKRIENLSSQLPPKHMRTTPKIARKARIIEGELARIRRKYMMINFKRITVIFFVYGIGLILILYKLPYMLIAPAKIPIITFTVEDKPVIPTSYIFLMGILALSPLALRIAEPPEQQ